jgi:hypothetical protein
MARVGRPRIYPPICLVEGCENPHRARGFCDKHYAQWKYDHPEEVRPRSRNGADILEIVGNHTEITEDGHWVWTGSYRRQGSDLPQVSHKQFKNPNVRVVLWEFINESKLEDHKTYTVRSQGDCPRGCVNPDHLQVELIHKKGINSGKK